MGQTSHGNTLLRVMMFGTALSFGGLGAIILSMKDFFHGDASFQFTSRTVVGFVVGFIVGWLFSLFFRKKILNR